MTLTQGRDDGIPGIVWVITFHCLELSSGYFTQLSVTTGYHDLELRSCFYRQVSSFVSFNIIYIHTYSTISNVIAEWKREGVILYSNIYFKTVEINLTIAQLPPRRSNKCSFDIRVKVSNIICHNK